ncbi:phosphatidate cytidylyltransferase [Chlamydoabsidia padenii]|nr:phosphatidate cytidylyltransferase [Chlamydoabsidia padenii]
MGKHASTKRQKQNDQGKESSNVKAPSSVAAILLKDEQPKKKWHNMWIRTLYTLLMIGGFFLVLASGYIWSIIGVLIITVMVYNEVVQIACLGAQEQSIRWFKTMSWYFLITTEYFLYGESILYYFKEIVMVDAFMIPFATHHRFISFMLYVIGFVFFVINLQKGQYQIQMAQFGWTHMALFLIVVQSHFIVDNILEGLIWFVLPVALVICNDVFAYLCGFFFGRTPLIQLSPKKTVEGFVGALLCTLVLAFGASSLLMQFDYMICPVQDLGATAWSGVSCDPKNPVFRSVPWALPPIIQYVIHTLTKYDIQQIWIAPVQLHAIVMACFASLIAPFGGFFASAVKRAFKIKDFGDSIPGHGGLTDRMDCQFLMGFFAHVYYHSFIKKYYMTVGSVLTLVINNMTNKEKLELLERLQTYLVNQNILESDQIPATLLEKAQQYWSR